MSETAEETRQIEVPARLLDKVETRAELAGFESSDEYVTFVLEEVLTRVERSEGESVDATRQVQSRLESLGYLE